MLNVIVFFLASDEVDFDCTEYDEIEDQTEPQHNLEIAHDAEPRAAVNTERKSVQRGRKKFINARVVSALDKGKVNDPVAIHIIIAVADALGHKSHKCSRAKFR